jgi:hypothetical protein
MGCEGWHRVIAMPVSGKNGRLSCKWMTVLFRRLDCIDHGQYFVDKIDI